MFMAFPLFGWDVSAGRLPATEAAVTRSRETLWSPSFAGGAAGIGFRLGCEP
jgi:hypothetical protein